MQRILIIEDEQDLADLIAFNLQGEGYAVTVSHDGREGLESALEAPPDLIILDLMLPTLLGTEVCKRLKGKGGTAGVPVIMLTAKGEEIDRVVGFEVGADDYVVKPFSVRELLLRVRALLRRTGGSASSETLVRIGDLAIDIDRHQVTVADEPVVLTTTEFKLLHILAERRGRLQSRDKLLKDVWGYSYVGDTRTVDTHVTRLRTKLGPAGDMIKTVRGFGYKLEEA